MEVSLCFYCMLCALWKKAGTFVHGSHKTRPPEATSRSDSDTKASDKDSELNVKPLKTPGCFLVVKKHFLSGMKN